MHLHEGGVLEVIRYAPGGGAKKWEDNSQKGRSQGYGGGVLHKGAAQAIKNPAWMEGVWYLDDEFWMRGRS